MGKIQYRVLGLWSWQGKSGHGRCVRGLQREKEKEAEEGKQVSERVRVWTSVSVWRRREARREKIER